MANYTLKYIQCFWEKDYNNNKDKLPEHRVFPMEEALPYIETSWGGKVICIERSRPINKSINKEIDGLTIKFINKLMVKEIEKSPIPILRFKILDENNNVIYSSKDLKRE